jgi:hypothetical protein
MIKLFRYLLILIIIICIIRKIINKKNYDFFNVSDLYTGDVGDKGERGEYGDRGDIGLQGDVGGRGLDGYKGEQGNYGLAGEKGDKGIKGRKGIKGDNGLYGKLGDLGEIGENGRIGPAGISGFVGPPGNIGDTGETGKEGEEGSKGLIGYQPALVQDYEKCYWMPTNKVDYKRFPGHHSNGTFYKEYDVMGNRHECMEHCTRDYKCAGITFKNDIDLNCSSSTKDGVTTGDKCDIACKLYETHGISENTISQLPSDDDDVARFNELDDLIKVAENDLGKETENNELDPDNPSNIYEGEYLEGVRHGKGKMTYVDGSVYEGNFENGKPNGKGTIICTNENSFSGDFIDGQMTDIKGNLAFPTCNIDNSAEAQLKKLNLEKRKLDKKIREKYLGLTDVYLKIKTSDGTNTKIQDDYTSYWNDWTLECKDGYFMTEVFFENNCGGFTECQTVTDFDESWKNDYDTRMRARCCPISLNDIPQKDFLWKRIFGLGGNGKKVLYHKMFLEMDPENELLTIDDLDVSFKKGWYIGGMEASKSKDLNIGHMFDRDDYEFIMIPVGYVTKKKFGDYLFYKKFLFDNLYKYVDEIFEKFCHEKDKMFVFNFIDFINQTLIEVFSFGFNGDWSIRYTPVVDAVSKKYLWHNTYNNIGYDLEQRIPDPVAFNDKIEQRRYTLQNGGLMLNAMYFPGLEKLRETRKKVSEIKKDLEKGDFEIDSLEDFVI